MSLTCRLLLLPLLICALQSCSRFNTPDARRNTTFFLRDTTNMSGELLGVIGDSIVVLRSDRGEPDSLRTITSLHYRDLDFATFHNDASSLLNGAFGLVLGGFTGGVAGLIIGASSTNDQTRRGWNALFGFFIGGNIGGITGLILGIVSGTNTTVQVDRQEDLDDLLRFARFKDAEQLQRYRGY